MKRTAKLNLITAVCSGMLAAIFQIVFCFAPSMAMQVVLLVVTALLYLTPFVINLKTVRDYCMLYPTELKAHKKSPINGESG